MKLFVPQFPLQHPQRERGQCEWFDRDGQYSRATPKPTHLCGLFPPPPRPKCSAYKSTPALLSLQERKNPRKSRAVFGTVRLWQRGVVVRGHAVGVQRAARPAALNERPLAIFAHPHTDGVHNPAALRCGRLRHSRRARCRDGHLPGRRDSGCGVRSPHPRGLLVYHRHRTRIHTQTRSSFRAFFRPAASEMLAMRKAWLRFLPCRTKKSLENPARVVYEYRF